ncbi:MAG: hypothetical protein ACK559_07450, partial [bacterium]
MKKLVSIRLPCGGCCRSAGRCRRSDKALGHPRDQLVGGKRLEHPQLRWREKFDCRFLNQGRRFILEKPVEPPERVDVQFLGIEVGALGDLQSQVLFGPIQTINAADLLVDPHHTFEREDGV